VVIQLTQQFMKIACYLGALLFFRFL